MAESYGKEWQLATLRGSVETWNRWRKDYPEINTDLIAADQHASDLQEDTEDPMATIESSIDIQRPVEPVFAYIADLRNVPQWVGATKESHVTPEGPPIVGTKVTQVVSFLGVKLEATGEITALEPNRSFSFKSRSGPAAMEVTYRFEAAGAGTRLSATHQVEPGGLLKVAGPLFASQFKHEIEADFQRLKHLLEAPQG